MEGYDERMAIIPMNLHFCLLQATFDAILKKWDSFDSIIVLLAYCDNFE
jgi:hypothetical protein